MSVDDVQVSKLDNDSSSKLTRPTAPAPSKAAAPPASVYNPSKPSGYELFFKTFAPEVSTAGTSDAQPPGDMQPLRSPNAATPVKQASLHAMLERRSRRESLEDLTAQANDPPVDTATVRATGLSGSSCLRPDLIVEEAWVSGENVHAAAPLLHRSSGEITGVFGEGLDPVSPLLHHLSVEKAGVPSGCLVPGTSPKEDGQPPAQIWQGNLAPWEDGCHTTPSGSREGLAERGRRGPVFGAEDTRKVNAGEGLVQGGDAVIDGGSGGEGEWEAEEHGDIEVEQWTFPSSSEDEEERWKELGSQDSRPTAAPTDSNCPADARRHLSATIPLELGAFDGGGENPDKPLSSGPPGPNAGSSGQYPGDLPDGGRPTDAAHAPAVPALSEIGAAEFAQLPAEVQQALLQGAGVPVPREFQGPGLDLQRVAEHVTEGSAAWDESEALVDPEFGGALPPLPGSRPGSASGFGSRFGSAAGSGAVRGGRLPGLPSASQVDPSVLDALPLPLKRELERALGESPALCHSPVYVVLHSGEVNVELCYWEIETIPLIYESARLCNGFIAECVVSASMYLCRI